jgi:hypothetical protein
MKRRKVVITFLTLLVILTGAVLFAGGKSEGDQVQFSIPEEGTNMNMAFQRPEFEIILDEGKFRNLHRRIHQNKIPQPNLPNVDFNSYFVVFLTYGEQPSSGYFIQVRTVLRRDSTVIIRTLLKEPPQDSYQAQAVTQPYVFIAIPRDGFDRVDWANVTGEVLFSRPL